VGALVVELLDQVTEVMETLLFLMPHLLAHSRGVLSQLEVVVVLDMAQQHEMD
jgi:hypothetical protein